MAILVESEAGSTVAEVCRKHGISSATYFQWKGKYTGTTPNDRNWVKDCGVDAIGVVQTHGGSGMIEPQKDSSALLRNQVHSATQRLARKQVIT